MMASLQFLCALTMIYMYFLATVSTETPHLPRSEKLALAEIAKELGKKDWNFSLNPCDGNSNWNTSGKENTQLPQSFLICNCSFRSHHICHIERLILRRQDLAGVLPRSVAKLPHLKILDLDRNYLSGNIPKEWASTKLETLILSANRLSGPIPDYLGNITTLVYLSLETNRFEGEIPAQLGKLIKLERLILSANRLSGKFPLELYSLTNLRQLRLSNNEFSGKLPSFQPLKSLNILELQSSGFEGPIPLGISALNLTELRIKNLKGGESEFPYLGNMIGLNMLMLSGCNINGDIPRFFSNFTDLLILDLSFNKLQGNIPDLRGLRKPQIMYLTGNNLSGPLPEWIKTREPKNQIDLSYNNFDQSSLPCSRDTLNLFRSFSRKNATDVGTCLHPCTKDHYSFHINCGGPAIKVGKVVYEEDSWLLGSEKFDYTKEHWGSSSTGIFWDTQTDDYVYVPKNRSTLHIEDPTLYMTARVSPLTLTYYGRCLANGNYTVTIRFAEIVFRDGPTYQSLGIRMFDIYIQGERRLQDFDIMREAGGANRALIRNFSAQVMNKTLEIRLQYTRGTTNIPVRGSYGSLVSAISVESDFQPPSNSRKKIIIIIGASVALILIIIGLTSFLLWKRYAETRIVRDQELSLLDVQRGNFTYNQILSVTNNFSEENKLGTGGFGTVYKGTLSDGTTIAVKKLQERSRKGDQQFITEVGLISALRHPNIISLYGCCIDGEALLLVYEYMENNSLGRALYGPDESRLHLDWPTRKKICVGVARGVAYLHESALHVVHRDIKPNNILLDREFNPKVSDFGTAKLYGEASSSTSVPSGPPVGTVGYTAPEYALRQNLTLKADVYSFGVLALEVVTGIQNMKFVTDDFACLVEWATFVQTRGNLMQLVDPKLGTNYIQEEAEKLIRVILLCLSPVPALRPTMSQLLSILEGDTSIEDFTESELTLLEMRNKDNCFFSEGHDPDYFDKTALSEIQEVED